MGVFMRDNEVTLNDEALLRLRTAIHENMPPAHCAGCDEWACGGEEERPHWGEEYTEDILMSVLEVLAEFQITTGSSQSEKCLTTK